MNVNNFAVLPNKPKSVKINVRNLRELRIETAQLKQDNKDMENRLQQLQEVMSREKDERKKNGAFHRKSAPTQDGTSEKEKKLKKSSPSKIKLRVLKDEPVQRVPEPPPPKNGWNRKSRLKGKACGQCEAQTAGLVCAECSEDYCVSCFAKFHQKGALRFHHIIPMQAELHTSISTVDVVNCLQKKLESEEEEDLWLNHASDMRRIPASALLQPICDNQMHNTQVLSVNDLDQENKHSLLRGSFDEEESSRCFQQALNEWRAGNTHGDREHHEPNHNVQTAQLESMEAMGTQAGGRPQIHIEFRNHGLSYMERLLMKKHRRMQIESYQLLSTPRSTQDLITDTCAQPVEEIRELTAEEMDMHHYCVSLFAVSSSAKTEVVNNIFKPSITEIDETAGDSLVDASFGVKQKDKKEQKQVDALARLHPTNSLEFSLKTQALVNDALLSGSLESSSQSPPSDQHLSSLICHNLQKSVDISSLKDSAMLHLVNYKEHALQEAQSPKLLKPQMLKYPSKPNSALKCTTQGWEYSSSTSPQTYSSLISTDQCQSPTSPDSSNPQLSLTHLERYQTRSNTPNLPLPLHLEEEVECQTNSSVFLQAYFKPANETMLSQFSQLPLSDNVSSFAPHKCQKAVISDILNSSAPALIMSHQQGKHIIQRALSPRHSDFQNLQTPKGPSSAISNSAVDWNPSLSRFLQPHRQLLSSSAAFPTSFMEKLSPISPEGPGTNVLINCPNSSLSKSIQVGENKKMFTQLFKSPRLTDFQKNQNLRTSLKATLTQSVDSSHGPSPSTSFQSLPPAVSISAKTKLSLTPSVLHHTKAKTLTQSGNTPLSAEQPFTDDEEPYFLPLGSTSSTKSEILQISLPLSLCLSDSDMSSDSVGMLPNDKDSSDEEIRRCALQDMEEEEERNTSSLPPSLFPTSDNPFPSQSPTNEDQSGFFTKPCLAVSSLAQRHNIVSTNYQGLDGFFTLGLDSRSVPVSPAASQASTEMHTIPTNSEVFVSGDSFWRPETSLQPDSEATLVGVLLNNQPINITSQSDTPISKVEPSQRKSQSDPSVPVTQSVSRTALGILEVQSVEQSEITHIKQDDEDLLTIACLEEEFKQMNTELNLVILVETENNGE